MNQTTDHKAPRSRRAAAWLVDSIVVIAIASSALWPLGLLLALDQRTPFAVALATGMFFGFSYLALAPRLFGNTLGKYLFALRTVGLPPNENVSYGRYVLRTVVMICLWPVNAGLALWSSSRAHLGDKVARTAVLAPTPMRTRIVAVAIIVVSSSLLLKARGFLLKAASTTTSAYALAKSSLQETKDATTNWLPSAFSIDGNGAIFFLEGGGNYYKVALVRRADRWNVLRTDKVAESRIPILASFDFSEAKAPLATERPLEKAIANGLSNQIGLAVRVVRCPPGALFGEFKCIVETLDGTQVPFQVKRDARTFNYAPTGDGRSVVLAAMLKRGALEESGVNVEVTCPKMRLVLSQDEALDCKGTFSGRSFDIHVVVTKEGKIKSHTFDGLWPGPTLEQRATEFIEKQEGQRIAFSCPEKAYVYAPNTEIRCPAKSRKDVYAVFVVRSKNDITAELRRTSEPTGK